MRPIPRSASSSVVVIGTTRRVRPFGVPAVGSSWPSSWTCWFTVIVPAMRSTSSRHLSPFTSPIRSPASAHRSA
jgi:hypothetical protein